MTHALLSCDICDCLTWNEIKIQPTTLYKAQAKQDLVGTTSNKEQRREWTKEKQQQRQIDITTADKTSAQASLHVEQHKASEMTNYADNI